MTIEFLGGPLDGTEREYPEVRWPPAVIRTGDGERVYRYRYGGATVGGSLVYNYEGME
ncbi:MAG: hypothetical protein ACK5XN_31895 [Bacteroidota bacterium]